MKHFELNGQIREAGNKASVKVLRKEGLVPCNLYGYKMENILFSVSIKDINKLINTPEAHIVDINLNAGGKYTAVVHELQFHPVNDTCLHVDFLSVNEEKPIVINVPVEITGHAIGVQNGGKFFMVTRSIKISALMKDLPDNLPIDISGLDIEKQVTAGDLNYDNVTILTPKDTIVCVVRSTRQIAAQAAREVAAEESALGTPAAAPTETAAPAAAADAAGSESK
jgi:large subunit ribosomal protein L25